MFEDSLQEFVDRKGGRVQSPRAERLKCRGWSEKKKATSDRWILPFRKHPISEIQHRMCWSHIIHTDHVSPRSPSFFQVFPGRFEVWECRNHPNVQVVRRNTGAGCCLWVWNDPVAGLQLQVVWKGAWLSHLENLSWAVRVSKHLKASQIKRWGNVVQVLHQMWNEPTKLVGASTAFGCCWIMYDSDLFWWFLFTVMLLAPDYIIVRFAIVPKFLQIIQVTPGIVGWVRYCAIVLADHRLPETKSVDVKNSLDISSCKKKSCLSAFSQNPKTLKPKP